MGSFIQNERKLCGGRVMLYQRTDVRNAVWQCRISFPKQPAIRHSLSTTDGRTSINMFSTTESSRCWPPAITGKPGAAACGG